MGIYNATLTAIDKEETKNLLEAAEILMNEKSTN